MNVEELEKWVLSGEGLQWLENKKSGLVKKNTELLAELKKSNAELTTATDKSNALAEQMGTLEKTFLADFKERFFEGSGIFPILKNAVWEKIINNAKENGDEFKVVCDNGKFNFSCDSGTELKEYLVSFQETTEGKESTMARCSGGGATGSNSYSNGVQTDLNKMSVEQIANNLNNPEFRNSLNRLKGN